MTYTAAQLTNYYTLVNQGIAPDATMSLLITSYAAQDAAGTLTDAQTLYNTLNTPQTFSTTDVAVATYAFWTGTIPSAAGMAFLVNSGANTADLNDPYYAQFNQENRYYNFAINLGLTPASAAAAAFIATYTPLTLAQTISTAYETIIGTSNVGAAAAAAAIASITTSIPFFQAVAAQRASGFNQDLATKAIIIGYIMEEGIKADVGTYAKAVDQFNAAVAGGVAIYGPSTPLSTYSPGGAGFGIGIGGGGGGGGGGTPGSTLTFTGGIDNLPGTVNDDTFNANLLVTGGVINAGSGALLTTLQAADTATGGGGNDTLNLSIVDPTGGSAATGSITVPTAAISGIKNIFVRGGSTAAGDIDTVNATGFTGAVQFVSDRSINQVNFGTSTAVGALVAGQSIGVNGNGALTLGNVLGFYGVTVTAETLNLTGGTGNGTPGVGPTVILAGGAPMVTATVNSSGAANTIGVLNLNTFGATVTTLNIVANTALTTGLIANMGSATAGATETVVVSGAAAVTTGAWVGGGGNVTTLSITTNSSTLTTGNITGLFSANATINVGGPSATSVANAASVTLGVLEGTVRTLNAGGLTAGGVAATIGLNTAIAFTGGAGTDIVTVGAGQGAALTGLINGAGSTTDIIAFSTGADLAANLTALVSNFEVLRVSSGGGTQVYNPLLINGITSYQVAASAGGVTLNSMLAAPTVTDIGSVAGTLTLNLGNAGGADTLNLTLNNLATTGVNISGVTIASLAMGGSGTAGQVETLNLTSSGFITGTGTWNAVTEAASGAGPNFLDANTVKIFGAVGVTFTTGVTAHSQNIDASLDTGGVNIVNLAALTGTATITGSAVNDTINSANTALIIGGNGGDSIILGAGVQTLQYAVAANSQLNVGETDATTLGNNSATATTLLAGASGVAAANTGGMDIVNGFVSGTDKIDLSAFGLSGALQGVADAGTVTSDAQLATTLGTAGIFLQGINTRGVTQIHGTAAMSSGVAGDFIVVDVNRDGVYTAGTDMVFKLVGVATVVAGDFAF